MSLLSIFATAILPVVALATAGLVLGRRKNVDVAPLNTVTVYVLVPALVFHSLATTLILTGELSGQAGGDLDATEDASTAIFVTTLVSVPIRTGFIAILQAGLIF